MESLLAVELLIMLEPSSMLAAMGVEEAVAKDKALMKGLNVYAGGVCYEPVARDLHMDFKPYKPH